MTTQYAEVEVWVIVNECGDWVASDDPDHAAERFEEQIGELNVQDGVRRVKVKLKVPLPTVIELAGAVECDESRAGLAVA